MNSFVEQSLKLIKTLKPFPLTVMRINALLSDPFYSVNKLINIIRYDAALTVDLLKMANSPYFGARKKFSSIKQAVNYLGAEKIQKMIFLRSIKPYFSSYQTYYELNEGELWQSSVAGGLMAETLAEFLKIEDSQTIFTASLLRDIGKIIFGKIIEKHPQKKEQIISLSDKSFDEREEILFKTTHSEIGALVLKHWEFPQSIIDAVKYHHTPYKSELKTTHIVAFSDILVMIAGVTTSLDGLSYRGNNLQEEFDLTQKEIDRIMAKSIQKYNSAVYEMEI